MPSFDLTRDEIIFLLMVVTMVMLPSRLALIGNLVGRLVNGRPKG